MAQQQPVDLLQHAHRGLAAKLPAKTAAADAGMLAAEVSHELQQAMAKLDDTTRQMILLRHMGEVSFKELAELFDCPLGTALARVHRGLQTLRRSMGSGGGTE